jgi:hypothetical protein
MKTASKVVLIGAAVALAFSVGACARRPPPAEPAPAVEPPAGATLESESTTVVDGVPVTTRTYRLPNELLTNGPQCTKGDPQCP